MTLTIDLGSGPVPKNPFNTDEVYGCDIAAGKQGYPENVLYWDAVNHPIPFKDSSAKFIVCTDFLEHVPRLVYMPSPLGGSPIRKQPFIDVMSEIWRVLEPGGILEAKTPAFPRPEAFQDPTHVNIISENTWDYFAGGLQGLCREYGFKGEFEPALPQRWEGYWLVWTFRAIK